MTNFMQRSAKHFAKIKAVREIKQEIEKAGLDNLKILADAGKSIIGIYLNGCSPQEQARIRRDFNILLQIGVTADMVLNEVVRQMPELAPIIDGRDGYKKGEIENLLSFLKER